MPQTRTDAEDRLVRTSPRLTRATRIELVSRSNPNDIREAIDTRDRGYDPERTGLIDGSVTVETAGEALRRLSLSLIDWTGKWFPGAGRSLWLDAQLRVYRGYVQTQLWPQGVYEVMDPSNSGRHQVDISGVDKSSRASGRDQGGFTTVVKIPKGTNLKTALTTLAGYPTWGETQLLLDDTTASLPFEQECLLTDFPWQKFGAIAVIPGDRRHYYDERGWLRWHVDPDPNLLAPTINLFTAAGRPSSALPGEYARIVKPARQIDAHGLKNWVGVKGGGGKSMPVFAYAADEDPNSPTSVQNIGHRIYWHNGGRPDPLITTQAEAQARADYELRRLLQWQERVSVTITELPYLQPWDVCRATAPDAGLNDNYQVVGYTLPLAGRADMQLQLWRVRKAVA